MEPSLIKFPSIGQFYQTVSKIKHEKLTFFGTIKLNGTNAAIGYSEKTGLWYQSHKKIITTTIDNFKFAATMEKNSEGVKQLLFSIAKQYSIDLNVNALIIYGEFCGGNIQKNVAINGLPNMFVIFDIAYIPLDEISNQDPVPKWLDIQKFPIPELLSKLVYNILDFPTYTLEIEFTKLSEIKDILIKLTDEVEKECPVGKYFGKSGTGEGIVWKSAVDGEVHRFKVKGQKHSTSKITDIASINVEKAKSLEDFVNKTVTENRLRQGINEIFGDEPQSQTWFSKIENFIQWVIHDVKKEDMDAFPLELKENESALNRAISMKSREWFRHLVELG